MKKLIALVLSVMMLFAASAALAEQPVFNTLGDVFDISENAMRGGDETYYVVAVEKDGKFYRVVAELDDQAKALNDAIMGAEDLTAAFEAYYAYTRTLPVAYTEEITAAPKSQEELDAFVGRTIADIKAAGFESFSSWANGDDVVFGFIYGLYDYDFDVECTMDEYLVLQETYDFDGLKVKSGRFAGLSSNAVELRYHADGTVEEEPEEENWGEASEGLGIISELLAIVQGGEEADPDALIEKLVAMSPENEEQIRTMVPLILSGSESAAEEETPGMLSGGWTPAADPAITDEVKALLEKGLEGLDGVSYEPVTYLGSQVVAGTNHAILCKATVLTLNAIPTWKIVYLYQDLQGNVSIMNIADFDAGSLCTYGGE